MEEELNKSIRSIKEIRMTDTEKAHILKAVLNSPIKPVQVKSPYWQRGAFTYALASFLVLVLGGSTAAMASRGSLPGEALYGVKVKLLEPARAAMILSPVKKEEYKIKLEHKRVREAETVLLDPAPDPKKEKIIDKFLAENAETINKSLVESRATGGPRVIEAKIKERYSKKKDSLNSLIDKKTADNEKAKEERKENPDKKERKERNQDEDRSQKLLKAKKFLEDAEEDKVKGEEMNAYLKLLDSERTVQEAEDLSPEENKDLDILPN